tara:strand:- start:18515 stop:20038 length:1524 start_codon:yes stop_codon:yes gene_type:complete
MSKTPDMNIKNWSIEDIQQLFEVDKLDPIQITKVADRLIDKSISDENTSAITFLKQARDKLLTHISSQNELGDFGEQASSQLIDWWQNQYLTQSDENQAEKATTRQNHVDTFEDENGHYQMKRETLGITQTLDVGVAQGSINPNLKNIVERTIIIDSQYRPNIFPFAASDTSSSSYSSSFTATLSDPLQNVLSLELYSVQIPKTWYNISPVIGNSCFGYVDASVDLSAVTASDITWYSVTAGNYVLPSSGGQFSLTITPSSPITFTYNSITNKITVTVTDSSNGIIIWYSQYFQPDETCGKSCIKAMFPNNNLGWTLGFRDWDEDNKILYTDLSAGTATTQVAPQLSGPQYMLLTLDDFNNNRLNKGIISTVQSQTKLDLPSYYNPLSQQCDDSNNVFTVKSAPRQLTQAQLYTINTIYQDRQTQKTRPNAPTSNNVLAVIPIPNDTAYGDNIVLFGPDMSTNSRDYFGPVTIERIKTSLLDDKGNLIDLNGADWSFTFRMKQLYQY